MISDFQCTFYYCWALLSCSHSSMRTYPSERLPILRFSIFTVIGTSTISETFLALKSFFLGLEAKNCHKSKYFNVIGELEVTLEQVQIKDKQIYELYPFLIVLTKSCRPCTSIDISLFWKPFRSTRTWYPLDVVDAMVVLLPIIELIVTVFVDSTWDGDGVSFSTGGFNFSTGGGFTGSCRGDSGFCTGVSTLAGLASLLLLSTFSLSEVEGCFFTGTIIFLL